MSNAISNAASTSRKLIALAAIVYVASARTAAADAVTDWNEYTIIATKGGNGEGGTGLALNSNVASRVHAVAQRAVFDAVNSIVRFHDRGYHYVARNAGSPQAAAAQAAHDAVLALLPDPVVDTAADPKWAQTRAWLDARLASYLAELHVAPEDGGIAAGKAAAAAAVAARRFDNAAPGTTYGAQLGATTNPGIGLWRQSNAAAGVVNPVTGAPTGFDAAGVIQGRPGIDLNWRDVTPFSLTTGQKVGLVGAVPFSPAVGSPEYALEVAYVRDRGGDTSSIRTADQTAQALYYKQDAEIFVHEAARVAARARRLSLDETATLFALLANAVADTRIAAFSSKYDQKFWRPITALNADADGAVTNGHVAWRPLAATPSHPSNTAGHSATVAAGVEILRAFFASDRIVPNGSAVTLGSLPWLVGTNSGTGVATTRAVATFSQIQLENGASRLYLGVHYGYDNLQGQLLGLAAADTILLRSNDPAADGLRIKDSPASYQNLLRTLLSRPDVYGYFGKETQLRR